MWRFAAKWLFFSFSYCAKRGSGTMRKSFTKMAQNALTRRQVRGVKVGGGVELRNDRYQWGHLTGDLPATMHTAQSKAPHRSSELSRTSRHVPAETARPDATVTLGRMPSIGRWKTKLGLGLRRLLAGYPASDRSLFAGPPVSCTSDGA